MDALLCTERHTSFTQVLTPFELPSLLELVVYCMRDHGKRRRRRGACIELTNGKLWDSQRNAWAHWH